MAGDDEELSLLLSSIPDHSQEAEINNLLFSVQSMETGDMISQLLNSENFYTEDTGGQVVRDKERSVSLSVSSPESGVGSEEPDMGAISPGAAWDMTPLSVEPSQTTVRSLSNKIAFYSPETVDQNMASQTQYGDPAMATLLAQLNNESQELLADTESDLARLTRVKNNYRPSSVITSPGNVFVTGPNHRGTVYTDRSQAAPTSVIVRNDQAKQHTQPPPSEPYSVDFSQPPIIISLPQVAGEAAGVDVISLDLTEDTKEDQDIFRNFEISVNKDNNDYMCYVCGEKAGKHSYYGGQVCASCRAFFRRSVQSKYYEIFQCKFEKRCRITLQTRKTCQFCRFKKCLEAGMKPSWVLSDEERNRRFNKLNKLKSSNSNKTLAKKEPSIRVPEIYITFTLEEQKLIEFIQNKFNFCHQSWLRNMLIIDRGAGINLIEAAYQIAPLKPGSFKTMQKACHIFFVTKVLPNFINLDTLTSDDQAQILHGRTSNLSHMFKTSQCLKMERVESGVTVKAVGDMCPLQKQVAEIAADHEMAESVDLTTIMSRFKLGWNPRFPTYREAFPPGWTQDKDIETRHEVIMRKIQSWPRDSDNQLDHTMLLIFCLVLLFSADHEKLQQRELVENVQLKYTTLLRRYLKSKMAGPAANKKFLEAIMLISDTKELWDINERYIVE